MSECFICHTTANLERHHIYGGRNRKISERLGLVVYLCVEHHRGANGVHFNAVLMQDLHEWGQREFEKTHTREEFMRAIGRNYL